MNKTHKSEFLPGFFISCPKGLEELLESELKNYPLKQSRIQKGGIYFVAKEIDAIKILLNTRIGSRLYLQIKRASVRSEKKFYDFAKEIPWDTHMDLDQTFKISTILDSQAKTKVNNPIILSQKVKDALVDSFREKTGKRPNVDIKNEDYHFFQRVEFSKGQFFVSLYLELSGISLSHRGYRSSGHQAPLRENLAAAIVMTSGYSFEKGTLIDPMCGTGTLLIEGAMQALNLPPTYLKIRNYIERKRDQWSFQRQNWYINNSKLRKEVNEYLGDLYNQISEAFNHESRGQILGFDISSKALDIASENFKKSKLNKFISLAKGDATKLAPESNKGVLLCNPPYGERLEQEDLEELYHNFGENLKKNFKGFEAYVLTSDPELRKKISLRTSKRIPLYNGPIECRLLKYELF